VGIVGRVLEWILIHIVLRTLVALTILFFMLYVAPSIIVWAMAVGK
jgi:hypothetical protein